MTATRSAIGSIGTSRISATKAQQIRLAIGLVDAFHAVPDGNITEDDLAYLVALRDISGLTDRKVAKIARKYRSRHFPEMRYRILLVDREIRAWI